MARLPKGLNMNVLIHHDQPLEKWRELGYPLANKYAREGGSAKLEREVSASSSQAGLGRTPAWVE
jgi:hypothetical protein